MPIPLPALIVGLEGITVVSREPAALAAPLSAVFGVSKTRETRQRLDIDLGGEGALRFLAPDRFDRRYPDHPFADNYPSPAVITLLVTELAAAAEALSEQPLLAVPGQRLVRLPAYAGGPLLEFAEK